MQVGDIVSINDVRPGDIFVRVTSSNTRLLGIVCTRYKDSLVHLGMAQNEAGSAEASYFLSPGSNSAEVKILGLADRCDINFCDGDYEDKYVSDLADGDFGYTHEVSSIFSDLSYKAFQMWGPTIVFPGKPVFDRAQDFLRYGAAGTAFSVCRQGRIVVEERNG